jgi:hypothetical protein
LDVLLVLCPTLAIEVAIIHSTQLFFQNISTKMTEVQSAAQHGLGGEKARLF